MSTFRGRIIHTEELKRALRMALDWIDAVPRGIFMPQMPALDRPWMDRLLAQGDVPLQTSPGLGSHLEADRVIELIQSCRTAPQEEHNTSFSSGRILPADTQRRLRAAYLDQNISRLRHCPRKAIRAPQPAPSQK